MKAVADLTLSRHFNGGRLNTVSSCRLILRSFILIFKLSNVYGIFIYTSFYVSFGLSWLCTRIFVPGIFLCISKGGMLPNKFDIWFLFVNENSKLHLAFSCSQEMRCMRGENYSSNSSFSLFLLFNV